ncbi:MAG TPA: metal-dependent hydrolase [Kofleriaceae bacterium]|nr:metal-dependent hydrolase [Kofleriaceae bacterium]
MTPTPVVRDLTFDLDQVPRHWHGGRRSVSIFFDNLSIFFPSGERFFVAAVKAHRDRATDPKLRDEVRAFCAQEGMHGREHVRYNRRLEEHGYPAAKLESKVERLLKRVTKLLSPRARLAVTCALEHFTSLMAHMLLEDGRGLEGADPRMAALWRWHAAEESEHKAVAFDLYVASGGGWWTRVWTMVGATIVFWAKVLEQQIRMMRADGCLWSPREWGRLAWWLYGKPGPMRKIVWKYLSYYRPSFHPWQVDTRALLEDWKTKQAA